MTLGFGEIIPQFVRNGDDSLHGFNLTNGRFGLTPIDPLGFGHNIPLGITTLPANFLTVSNADTWYYWMGLALVALTLFCSIRLRDSRLGRAWVAIREDEIAAGGDGRSADADEDRGLRHRARSSAASPAASTRSTRARRSRATST